MTKEQMIAWLEECARFFERRDTHGEDSAHWANAYNAKNAREIAKHIEQL